MNSQLFKKAIYGVSVVALASGIALTAALPSSAAVDGMTNNWSNWWHARAEVWIFNPNQRLQSVARIGDSVRYGWISNSYSVAEANGYSWTHEAYQIRWS